MAHNYGVGTRAWQPDAAEGWIASEVESTDVRGDHVKLVFRLENNEVRPMKTVSRTQESYLFSL
jgi:myosin V